MFSKEISCGFLEVDKEEKQAFTCHYLKGKKKKSQIHSDQPKKVKAKLMWGTVIALALRMLLNQTQVQSLAHSKVDLLMEACSEAKCSVYCKISDQSSGQLMLRKPELPSGFQGDIFKVQVRKGSPRICDQLVHNSLTG